MLDKLKLNRIDGETRKYETPDGKKYPSITTVLSKTKDLSHLMEWKNRVGEKEAAKITSKATRRGTKLHQIVEEYLMDNPLPTLDFDDKFRWNAFKPLVDRVSDVKLLEGPLYSDVLRTAGTVDCVASFDGVPSIIDWKTSSTIKKKEWIEDYFLQLSFYALAFEERYSITCPQIVVCMVSDEGESKAFVEMVDPWMPKLLQRRYDYAKLQLDK